ncbi:MAG TPA: two-component system response regulator, partial [Sphingobacterium sp.]|nr:two-component system response regulator [Sphingobacterium sp.]
MIPKYGHILLIEDDLDLATMLIDYLSNFGFDVSHAMSAEEGISYYKINKYDILVV